MIDPRKHNISAAKLLIIGSGVLVILGLLCFLGYRILERPKYIVLSIPLPSSLPRGNWSYTEYSTQVWSYEGGRYFVWRSEGEIRNEGTDSKFNSWESIVDYFGNRLKDDGWVLYEAFYGDPCSIFLHESDFLPRGNAGYIAYVKPEKIETTLEPTVCLAVWPDINEDKIQKYHVVLLTANPSFLTIWKGW
jgi:hypothetical protein